MEGKRRKGGRDERFTVKPALVKTGLHYNLVAKSRTDT